MQRSAEESRPEWDLILAASQKNLPDEIKRLVLEDGVSPSHSNVVDQSALHIAALWGNAESVRALVEMGANVNATNKLTGGTPLHVAVHSRTRASVERRKECCQVLLENGADPTFQDKYGSAPVDYCEDDCLMELLTPTLPEVFQAKSLKELQRVLTIDNVDVRFGGMTPLLRLVQDVVTHVEDEEENPSNADEMVQMMRLLLERGADPNAIPATGDDIDAISESSLTIVCSALRNVHKKKQQDQVVLLEQFANLLLNGGAMVDASLNQLVLDGTRRNELDFVKFCFTQLGMCPNVKGRQGMTAMHFCARSGQVDMVQYLLDNFHDVDLTAENDFGQTPLEAARTNNKDEVVNLLEQRMRDDKAKVLESQSSS